jgi:hypothetical protein
MNTLYAGGQEATADSNLNPRKTYKNIWPKNTDAYKKHIMGCPLLLQDLHGIVGKWNVRELGCSAQATECISSTCSNCKRQLKHPRAPFIPTEEPARLPGPRQRKELSFGHL